MQNYLPLYSKYLLNRLPSKTASCKVIHRAFLLITCSNHWVTAQCLQQEELKRMKNNQKCAHTQLAGYAAQEG